MESNNQLYDNCTHIQDGSDDEKDKMKLKTTTNRNEKKKKKKLYIQNRP